MQDFYRRSITSIALLLVGFALVACQSPSTTPTGGAIEETPTAVGNDIVATETPAVTEEMTGTDSITDTTGSGGTGVMTGTEGTTDTIEITDTLELTDTEGITDTSTVTGS
jgi:hypothetical protein